MDFNDFWINNNGKKEHLNNAKHGVRKEQVDKKFHNLFDVYDVNGDGTLEDEELKSVFTGLIKFAGADKTLESAENEEVRNLFSSRLGVQEADFMGFVRSISAAGEDIIDSKTTPTADGGKEVTTTYKDGTVETISYYPDGEYKFKMSNQKATTNTNYYTIGNDLNKKYSVQEIENRVKKEYNRLAAQIKANAEKNKPIEGKTTYTIPNYDEFKKEYLQRYNINYGSNTKNFERHDFELSERGKQVVAVRDFVLEHYIETHKAAKEALESMGILDDAGAAINAGAGELWNSIKNVWNGTDEEYQNFYELSKKFELNYNKALKESGSLEVMRNNPEMFFRNFETDFNKDTGHKFDLQTASRFQQITEQYQNAQILKQRINILNEAMQEIRMYQSEQDALVYSPAQSEGLNPASHIANANNLLLQYFDKDKKAVNILLNGTIGDASSTIKAIKDIKDETEKLNESVLAGKTFKQIQDEYKSQYKAMYGTDFVPDELTEKVTDAKATGGMVKLAAITAISVLITKSPIIAEISAAAGGAEVTGAAANMIGTLVSRYGASAVQQGIKLAMTSGTLATDVGLTLLNQVTSERGVNGEELWESAKSSAKYIYFGSYIGAPLAQAVSKQLGKVGATAKLFEDGVKSANGAIQTTSITGKKLVQNLMKDGNKVLTKGGAFLTDVAAFTGLEIATEGMNPVTAAAEQTEMLGKLKIMNHFIEYMLGGKVHAGMSKAQMDAAIEKSGVKEWNIKEIKTPNKTIYEVEVREGLPLMRFEDANQLATAMLEKVTASYSRSAVSETRTETETKPETFKPDEVETPKAEDIETPKTEKTEFRELSDEEFEAMKPKIQAKLNEKGFQTTLNKNNISVAEKILSDERLYNNKNVMNNIKGLISYTDTPEKVKLAEKILSDERLYNNENVMDNIGYLICYTITPERAKLAEKIFSDERLYNNKNLMNNIGNIIGYTENPESAKARIDIIDKILSDEKLLNNRNVMDNIGGIIIHIINPERAKLAEKILSDERLYNNKNVMNKIKGLISYTDTPERAKLAEKILSDERLYNNKNVMDNIGNIIGYTDTPEKAKLAEKILSDKRLYNNKNVMDNIGNLIRCTDTPVDANAKIDIIDKILSDKRLYNNKNVMDNIGNITCYTINPERAKLAEKIFSDERLYNNKNVMNNIKGLICYTENPESAKARIDIIDKIFSDKKLLNNKNVMDNIGNITCYTINPERAKLAEKILSDERLYNNKNVMDNIGNIIGYTKTPVDANAKIDIIDKILSDERLYNNKNVMNNIEGIICYTINPERVKLAEKILSNERLLNNKKVMDNIEYLIRYTGTPVYANAKIDIIDKILSDEKLLNNRNVMDNIEGIIYCTITPERAKLAEKIFSDERLYNNKNVMDNIRKIICYTENPESAKARIDIIDKILSDKKLLNNRNVMDNIGDLIGYNNPNLTKLILDNDINLAQEKVQKQYKLIMKSPEKYVNGEYDSDAEMRTQVDEFFNKNEIELTLLSTIFDKEALNNLFRMRFDNVDEYIEIVKDFDSKQLELLKELNNSCNINEKPFMPTQKIEFIDLLDAYKKSNLDMAKIEEMVKSGKIDLAQLHVDLFIQIMKNSGLTDKEIATIPKEKLVTWDTKYAHLLSKEINSEKNDNAFSDVLRAGSLAADFNEYLHDTSNVYGQANAKTRSRYNELNMNYDKWVKPSKENEVQFVSKDANTEQLQQVAAQITEDMNTLMQTPVKGFLKKQFPKFIKGDEFVIPSEYLFNKTKLKELVKILSDTSEQGQMTAVWNRAKGNAENPDPRRSATARRTLTILDHLNQRLSDIDKISDGKSKKQRNWTVKMWDRIPQKDIFQGNYSTCCIGIGQGNGSAMPHFLMNTAYNMIEIIDNDSGKTVGNALCYFITGADGKPAFIVDNIEINNSVKPSNNVGLQLRNAITEYAANISREVTGNENISIFMSSRFNDVPCDDLPHHTEKISFLGDIDCDEIYMDLYDGWVDKNKFTGIQKLLKLK